MSQEYKKAGVDIQAGEDLVDWIKSKQNQDGPHSHRLVSGVGGFAALFRVGFPEMQSPCLVSSTDGVGTKLKLAVEFNSFASVGQDLVAMCVNDLVCSGAQPLFFLDYYACGMLDLDAAKQFIGGVQKACEESGCALIGGETAEMPGVYHGKDFDCAGFSVGIVDESKALGSARVRKGDHLVAVASSGFHSNGYSLLRQVFAEDLHLWRDILMQPTALYASMVQGVLQEKDHGVHSVAHITGGGMDNILRVIPEGLSVRLKPWDIPSCFLEVKRRRKMPWRELLQTLNCGVGLVLIVDNGRSQGIVERLLSEGHRAWHFGEVFASEEKGSQWLLDERELQKLD